MERTTPSKTDKFPIQSCGKTDCTHGEEKAETRKTTGAENKDTLSANIFRKYYEALLQGYSGDFVNHQPTGLHCT